jgi:bacterioferritin (cytochrome b1)
MKGNPDIIKVLNEVLRKELTGQPIFHPRENVQELGL